MIEIYANLFIGSEIDYESRVCREAGWRVVHACKDPYHRQALGYSGRAASKEHPEYLVALRGERLILNLVDVPDPSYVRREIIDAALAFIEEGLRDGKRVLVHCNKGESRGPSIGFLYLFSRTEVLPISSFADAEEAYRKLYPMYNPAAGIRGFVQTHFDSYKRK